MKQTTLQPAYYTNPEIFAQEKEKIFFRNWLYVGHQSQVAQNGDYFTRTVLEQNLFILRGRDGKLRGFYNVCPHRAHQLLMEESGSQKVIICPYHAWVFETDGSLRAARGLETAGKEAKSLCISQFRVEVFCGFIFINFDSHAPAMAEVYPEAKRKIQQLVPDIEERAYAHHHSKTLHANWKIAVENYNECYHCPGVHSAFSSGVVSPATYRITPGTHTLFHTAQAPPPTKQAYAIDPSDEKMTQYASFYLWPTFSLQIYPGQVVNTFHWLPLGVEHTEVQRSWFFQSSQPTEEQWEIIELDRTTTFAEDLSIIDSVQQGLKNRGYRPGPLVLDPSGVATTSSENTVFVLKQWVLEALKS